jgi:hypothetical protein
MGKPLQIIFIFGPEIFAVATYFAVSSWLFRILFWSIDLFLLLRFGDDIRLFFPIITVPMVVLAALNIYGKLEKK